MSQPPALLRTKLIASVVQYEDNRPMEVTTDFPRVNTDELCKVHTFNGVGVERGPVMKSELKAVLEYIKMMAPEGSNLKKTIKSDFVTTASTLAQIAKAIECKSSAIHAVAVKRNDVIFLVVRKQEEKEKEMSEEEREGIQFKKLLTVHVQGEMWSEKPARFFKNIMMARIFDEESNGIFYSADFDIVDKDGRFAKIQNRCSFSWYWKNFTAFIWYARGILGNVSKTYYLDEVSDEGRRIRSISTAYIPTAVQHTWSRKQFVNSLSQFLNTIKMEITEEDKPIQYYFDLDLIKPIPAIEVDFLPESFVDYFV